MLDDALEKHRQGDLAGAGAIYQELLEAEPENHEVLHLYALLHQDQGELEKAHELLTKAIELRPEAATFRASLGAVLQAQGDLDGARQELAKALELNSNLVQAHIALGYLQMVNGDLELATQGFETALKIEPDSVPAMLNMANLYLLGGQVEKAVAFAQQAVDHKPNEPISQTTLGRALAAQGHPGFAEQCFRNALRSRPDYTFAKVELARVLTIQSKPDDAAELLQEVLAQDRDNIGALDALGDVALHKDAFSQAIQNYQFALTLDKNRGDILGKLGQAYLGAGDATNALRCLDVALERGFDVTQVHVSRGDCLALQGAGDQALQAYEKALALDPTDAGAWQGYGRVMVRDQRALTALERLTSELTEAQRSRALSTLCGRLALITGRPAEAVDFLERALDLDGEDASISCGLLGRAHHVLEQYESAAQAFLRGAQESDRRFETIGDNPRIAALQVADVEQDASPLFLMGSNENGLEEWLAYFRSASSVELLSDRLDGLNPRQDFLAQPEAFLALDEVPEATVRLSRKRYWRSLERIRTAPDKPAVDVVPASLELLRLIAIVFPGARVAILSSEMQDLALQALADGYLVTEAAKLAKDHGSWIAAAQELDIRCHLIGPPHAATMKDALAALADLFDEADSITFAAPSQENQVWWPERLLEPGSWRHYADTLPELFQPLS